MAIAIEWVAKITTIGLEMVLPGIFGLWLDGRWGTQFLGLLGFALGVTVGIWHLLRMTPGAKPRRPHDGDGHDSSARLP
jgi:hypothetical protein